MKTKKCVACGHGIDPDARLCPYCGADPVTGEKFDPTPIVKSHFPDRRELSAGERVVQALRERQGIVVAAVIILVFLAVGAAHQYVTRRAAAFQPDTPPVPLTDIADLADEQRSGEPAPLPEVGFQWTGRPEVMKVMLVEPGAVAPPQEQPEGQAAPGATTPAGQPAPPAAQQPRPANQAARP